MPTARGWSVALTGALVWLAGAVLGAGPLEQVGFALTALVAIGVVVVRLGRHDLAVRRRVAPERARPGQPVTVTITLANRGSGTAPLLLLEDRLPTGVAGAARFALQGIEPGGHRETSSTVTASRRGSYAVGPLEVSVVDPFGLARLSSVASPAASFLVHPRLEQLSLGRDLGERRSLATSSLRQPTGSRGEDFYTLREYIEGDDLRKIHWPSTAKRDRYMIRQEETPWQTRATILLDDRRAAHDGHGASSSFERAVEASASLVDLYHRSGYGFRLTAAHNAGLPSGRGSDFRNRCLDFLATVEPRPPSSADDPLLVRLAELEMAPAAEASLVLVTGTISRREAMALSRCRRRFKDVTTISFPAHRFGSGTTKARWEGEEQVVEVARLLARSGVRNVVLGPDESLAVGWATLSRAATRRPEGTWGQRPELV